MKLYALSLFLIVQIPLHGQWGRMADIPIPAFDDGIVLRYNEGIYLASGLDENFQLTDNLLKFYTDESWSVVSPGLSPRQYAVAWDNPNGNEAYYFGGINGNEFKKDLRSYGFGILDQQIATLPDSGRSGSGAFRIGDTLYLIGGLLPQGYATDQFWKYHLGSGTWTRGRDLPFGARWKPACTQNDTSGFLIYGRDSAGTYQNDFFCYRPGKGWKQLTTLAGLGRSHASMVCSESMTTLYLFGGSDSTGEFYNDLHGYDIRRDQWSTYASLPGRGRRGGLMFINQGDIYYVSGLTDDLT
ncbi:MAG: hypothetical protein HWE14_01740, partial [Flavobacteriia bacterium]|nr:hypothetical protein [Flavobacteriia bacterium]